MSNSSLAPSASNEEWAQAADKAKEAAVSVGEMASHAVSAVGAMANQAACDVGKKADDLTASAGISIQELSDRLGWNAPQPGILGSASQAITRTVKGGGEYLEDAKLSGLTNDVAELIRRNPIPSVLIAIGLGWFVGRKLPR
jgi:hypothetical protein